MTVIEEIEKAQLKDVPNFNPGDTLDVHVKIVEGEKERVQVFNGTCIRRKGGGMNETFTVRRIVDGEGVERIFLLHSPRIAKVQVKRRGRTRRAKLYYLRDRVGKATRLKDVKRKAKTKAQPAEPEAETPQPAEGRE